MNVFVAPGRLGADAELRTTSNGDKVLGFRIANDVGFGDRKTTNWVECAIWGQRAEKLAEYLTKGTYVVVTGELTLREFEKRDGTKGAGLSLRVAEVELGPKSDSQGGGGGRSAGGRDQDRDRGGRSDAGGGYGGGNRGSSGGGRGGYARDSAPPRHEDLDDEIPF